MYAQVTKLCDLGADDSVCSVGWAQRGTHLAVGTNNGKVQVVKLLLSDIEMEDMGCLLLFGTSEIIILMIIFLFSDLGCFSLQEGSNYGGPSDACGCSSMEFICVVIWQQG